eukprot:11257625-Ditylum_brightwellii.AAC.1
MNETLVCGETGPDGTYSLPVVIGSRVDYVDLTYHGHEFIPSPESTFESGMVIEEGYYGDNDFVDVEKARVIVEIVGGLCDKRLGRSTVHMKIVGCDWNKVTKPQLVDLETFTQSGPRQIYNSVPAHLLDIQVREIRDRDNGNIEHISNFFQGTQPIVRTIDLRDTNAAD